jgi:hypothetical protein
LVGLGQDHNKLISWHTTRVSHLSLSFNNLHSNLSIARATKMDESIDNLLLQFDDALFDDPTFNEFNCPLP